METMVEAAVAWVTMAGATAVVVAAAAAETFRVVSKSVRGPITLTLM